MKTGHKNILGNYDFQSHFSMSKISGIFTIFVFVDTKMTLRIRILLYLTFNTKSNQIPRTFLWPFSQTFGLVYSPLNSATFSCSSEVTLIHFKTCSLWRRTDIKITSLLNLNFTVKKYQSKLTPILINCLRQMISGYLYYLFAAQLSIK